VLENVFGGGDGIPSEDEDEDEDALVGEYRVEDELRERGVAGGFEFVGGL
jgi:hypothetical protein